MSAPPNRNPARLSDRRAAGNEAALGMISESVGETSLHFPGYSVAAAQHRSPGSIRGYMGTRHPSPDRGTHGIGSAAPAGALWPPPQQWPGEWHPVSRRRTGT